MFTQYFGHFLLNKGLVSAGELQSALDRLQSTHVKLGVLSVNAGFLSAAQADEVHQAQMRMDKRFGEIAVELGYLSEAQLTELLSAQKESHLVLSQALIDEGVLTLEQLSAAMQQYKDEHQLSDEQFAAVQRGDIDLLIASMLKLDDAFDTAWYPGYISLFVKNLIRFVDPQIYVEVNQIPSGYQADWLVSQRMTGALRLYSALGLGEAAFVRIASAYAEEELTAVDEMSRDAVGEFLNLHNGIFLVNISNAGTELDLHPQEIEEGAVLPHALQAKHLVTVYLSDGSAFDVIVGETA